MTNFEKVSNFIKEKKGTDVKLGTMTCFMGHFTNRIFIHHNYNLEKNGLFSLLHECGHALQPNENVGVNAYKKLKFGSKAFKQGRYENELNAWENAEMIAKELDLDMNWKLFYKDWKKSLKTYEF